MRRITVLVTSLPEGGIDPFRHGELEIVLHPWTHGPPLPLLDRPAWAFIDWLLPNMPGIEACRRLRCDPLTANCRITMVLESEDRDDARRALAAGANDYLVGPVSRAAILDRILVDEPQEQAAIDSRTIACGELAIDVVAFQARWRDHALVLMPNEFRLLRYFVEHPERVFTRTQLIVALGKQEPAIDERTVDVWVGRLRRALRAAGAGEPLRTVRGLGYVLDRR
jgi:two-component system, OmpR family, phosphate regulon response regulator PhoB